MAMGEAILWAICCHPVGFVNLGQGTKWLIWLVISVITGGLALIAMYIDYFMCNAKALETGTLGEWEFFPRS